eukprot:TRINITY_DN2128_c0_g1_i9.p2 TRINITY_DN2128_c0_g1~~TRINITY_DN2128_c0_g1_i9.p2  ORF type:complete len:191 (-),score=-21.43 TRINITY_DN2128_c0_g1_i9:829-1401(-)
MYVLIVTICLLYCLYVTDTTNTQYFLHKQISGCANPIFGIQRLPILAINSQQQQISPMQLCTFQRKIPVTNLFLESVCKLFETGNNFVDIFQFQQVLQKIQLLLIIIITYHIYLQVHPRIINLLETVYFKIKTKCNRTKQEVLQVNHFQVVYLKVFQGKNTHFCNILQHSVFQNVYYKSCDPQLHTIRIF